MSGQFEGMNVPARLFLALLVAVLLILAAVLIYEPAKEPAPPTVNRRDIFEGHFAKCLAFVLTDKSATEQEVLILILQCRSLAEFQTRMTLERLQ